MNPADLERTVARQTEQLQAAHRELEKRDQIIRALRAGTDNRVYERIPELGELADRLAALLYAAAPGPKSARFDAFGGISRPGRNDGPPAPGEDTAWLRGKVRHFRNKIGNVVSDLDDLLDPRLADKKRTGKDRPTCTNPECPQEGRPSRFGARFCDRCGSPFPKIAPAEYDVTPEDVERLRRTVYEGRYTARKSNPDRPPADQEGAA